MKKIIPKHYKLNDIQTFQQINQFLVNVVLFNNCTPLDNTSVYNIIRNYFVDLWCDNNIKVDHIHVCVDEEKNEVRVDIIMFFYGEITVTHRKYKIKQ